MSSSCQVDTASGTKIFIGTSHVDCSVNTAAAFGALAWTEIGLVESLGEFGAEDTEVKFTALNDGKVRKGKGSTDNGSLTISCARDDDDPGQAAFLAARQTKFLWPFKVQYNDQKTDSGAGSIEYFSGLAMNSKTNTGDANNVIKRTFMVSINSDIIPVAAT